MIQDENTAGAVHTTEAQKREYASKSLAYNFKCIQKFEPTFQQFFETLKIDPKNIGALPAEPEESKEVVPAEPIPIMSVAEFLKLVREVKEPLIVLDFTSLGGQQTLDAAFHQKYKHRFHHHKVPFQAGSPLAKNFGVTE